MVTRLVVPLAGFMEGRGVRGYSYAPRQPDGHLHTGADLNIGAGDEDLGMPILAFADGVVEAVREWDGVSYGFGTCAGVRHALAADISLWAVYAHANDLAVREGDPVVAGQQIGTVGKSGFQQWAHLDHELRWVSFDVLPLTFWGGHLSEADLSRKYADPYSLFRLAPAWDALAELIETRPAAQVSPADHAALLADRDWNYRIKMAFETELRALETRRRLKRGTVDALITEA